MKQFDLENEPGASHPYSSIFNVNNLTTLINAGHRNSSFSADLDDY